MSVLQWDGRRLHLVADDGGGDAMIARCPSCHAAAPVYRLVRNWPREVTQLVCSACAEATEAMVAGLGSEPAK